MADIVHDRTGPTYQSMLVGLLGVNLGLVFLDRTAFGLLAPKIQPEFTLSNTEVGMVSGALAITWAASSFGLTRAADLTGKVKLLLVAATIIFSLASISSGLAIGFVTLLAARALMGFAEGGLPPLTFDIVTREVSADRRGLAVGLTSTIGLQAIPMLGPVVIVGIGALYGWREAFWVAGVPGLILAAAIWLLIRNPARRSAEQVPTGSVGPLLKIRNMRFSMVLAVLNMTSYSTLLGFGPLYFVNVVGMSDALLATVMTGIGVAGVGFAFVGPMLSDRIGRRPVILGAYTIAIAGALMLVFANGSLPLVIAGGLLSAAGGSASGALIMAIIPGEAAPAHLKATAMGLNAAVGELLGAGAMSVAVGWIADRAGLGVIPLVLLAVAVLFCLISWRLTESAPKVLARRGAALAV